MFLFLTIILYICGSALMNILFQVTIHIAAVFGDALLRPFSFGSAGSNGYDFFAAAIGSTAMNNIQNIAISAGLGVAIVLLLFSLNKTVFGRYSHDAPDPYKTCVRFILAVIAIYWAPTLVLNYVLPFFQRLIDKAFLVTGSPDTLDMAIAKGLANSVKGVTVDPNDTAKTVLQKSFAQFGNLIDDAKNNLDFFNPIQRFANMLVLLISIIAVFVNMFKIVVENAERYLTTILLVIFSPFASATLVNEKTSEIFSAFCKMLTANLLTIFFNILGMKLLFSVFSNVVNNIWSTDIISTKGFIGIILVVGFSKMVQRLDQILSQLTFKINPIANRSLIMSGLATLGALNKGGKPIVQGIGKFASGVGRDIRGVTGGITGGVSRITTGGAAKGLANKVATRIVSGGFSNGDEYANDLQEKISAEKSKLDKLNNAKAKKEAAETNKESARAIMSQKQKEYDIIKNNKDSTNEEISNAKAALLEATNNYKESVSDFESKNSSFDELENKYGSYNSVAKKHQHYESELNDYNSAIRNSKAYLDTAIKTQQKKQRK